MQFIFDGRVIQDHFPGIGRYAYNLLREMPAHLRPEDELRVLRDSSAINTRYEWQLLIDRGIRTVEYRVPVFSLSNWMRNPSLPAGTQRDGILHFPYYMRPWRTASPSVTTIHDVISLVYPQLVPSTQARLVIRLAHLLAIRASRAIITVSQSAANDVARYFPAARGKTHVVYEAADNIFVPQGAERIAAIRRKFELPTHFAFFLASNKPHKNLVRLVEAWHLLPSDGPPPLVIAGHTDPRYASAQARAQELGLNERVRFMGNIPNADLPALYSACDLFIFPSLYEGFGLPPLEAMACGAPVACSRASSLPEVVGDAAVLFDPLRPDDIASAALRVFSNPDLQRELRARSLAQAARFTWAAAAHSTIEIYRAALV